MRYTWKLCLLLPLATYATDDRAVAEARTLDAETVLEWAEENRDPESPSEIFSVNSHYLPPVYNSMCNYYVKSVSGSGTSVELSDGSVWDITSWNQKTVLTWHMEDPLYLVPNTSWFSGGGYSLVNEANGDRVSVSFSAAPLLGTELAFWIVSIDYLNQLITLTNGVSQQDWKVRESDFKLLTRYRPGDFVMLGRDSGWEWWNRPYTQILINIGIKGLPFVRAYQL